MSVLASDFHALIINMYISKTECNLCPSEIPIINLRRPTRLHRIEINGTTLSAYEEINYKIVGKETHNQPVYTDHDACPVDLQPWEDNGLF